jgi:hypothetical protein
MKDFERIEAIPNLIQPGEEKWRVFCFQPPLPGLCRIPSISDIDVAWRKRDPPGLKQSEDETKGLFGMRPRTCRSCGHYLWATPQNKRN